MMKRRILLLWMAVCLLTSCNSGTTITETDVVSTTTEADITKPLIEETTATMVISTAASSVAVQASLDFLGLPIKYSMSDFESCGENGDILLFAEREAQPLSLDSVYIGDYLNFRLHSKTGQNYADVVFEDYRGADIFVNGGEEPVFHTDNYVGEGHWNRNGSTFLDWWRVSWQNDDLLVINGGDGVIDLSGDIAEWPFRGYTDNVSIKRFMTPQQKDEELWSFGGLESVISPQKDFAVTLREAKGETFWPLSVCVLDIENGSYLPVAQFGKRRESANLGDAYWLDNERFIYTGFGEFVYAYGDENKTENNMDTIYCYDVTTQKSELYYEVPKGLVPIWCSGNTMLLQKKDSRQIAWFDLLTKEIIFVFSYDYARRKDSGAIRNIGIYNRGSLLAIAYDDRVELYDYERMKKVTCPIEAGKSIYFSRFTIDLDDRPCTINYRELEFTLS